MKVTPNLGVFWDKTRHLTNLYTLLKLKNAKCFTLFSFLLKFNDENMLLTCGEIIVKPICFNEFSPKNTSSSPMIIQHSLYARNKSVFF